MEKGCKVYLHAKGGSTQMCRMIKEFPSHHTSGKVDSHYNFDRGTGRERNSGQKQYA